jgi:transposase-like protein
MLKVVADEAAREDMAASLDEIVREGARRMLAAALEDEVAAYIAGHAGERDENGRRLVVRNGHARPRRVTTAAGATEVAAPRVNDKRTDPVTGERMRFCSAILPSWARKTPQVTGVLPLLYLHGLSAGDFVPALGQFPDTSAGLSAPVITKLTEDWKAEARAFMARDLSGVDYVYLWADGTYVNIRLEEARLCLLVMIGFRADGRKELIALSDGYRESTGSWADLLRDCARRGMRGPVLAAGDGALGFWGALREAFPQTREQRCWFHKIANVLDAMPKSAHPGAKKALAEIWNAEDKDKARQTVKDFGKAYGAKFPKAVAKITDSEEELLAFYDYPAEHWIHLRTTNPIESTVATVRHRTKVTKAAGLAMAYKLIQSVQRRWRSINAPHLVALVRAGAVFVNGSSSNDPNRPRHDPHRAAASHPGRQRVLLPAAQGRYGRLHHRHLGVGRTGPARLPFPRVQPGTLEDHHRRRGRHRNDRRRMPTLRELPRPHRGPPRLSRPRHRHPPGRRTHRRGRAERPRPGPRRARRQPPRPSAVPAARHDRSSQARRRQHQDHHAVVTAAPISVRRPHLQRPDRRR